MWTFGRLHVFPDLTLLAISLAVLAPLAWWSWTYPRWSTPRRRALTAIAALALAGLFCAGYLLGFVRVFRHFPEFIGVWVPAASMIISGLMTGVFLAVALWRVSSSFRPERRAFFRKAGYAALAAPAAVTAFGIVTRNRLELNEVDVPIPNLPKDLHGLRITQVSDIHLSDFLNERELARAIDMANATRPDLMLVTGDLITRPGDPLDAAIRQIARLRAPAGVFGCHGNHEVYCRTEEYITEVGKRIGIDFLRKRARSLRFGNATLNLAGVDYQRFHQPYLVGTEELVAPGAFNVLLSHNPDVFNVAAKQGFDLTIAGHTHGGQVNFEILHRNVNVALAFTPYVRGLYRQGPSAIYVSSGIGTIGVPMRLGAPAEIAVLRLCAS